MADPNVRKAAVRPTPDQYFMLLAVATRERAVCLGRHVGAVLVADQRIIATGYNGTPTGFRNCDEGGCHRCAHPDDDPFRASKGFDGFSQTEILRGIRESCRPVGSAVFIEFL